MEANEHGKVLDEDIVIKSKRVSTFGPKSSGILNMKLYGKLILTTFEIFFESYLPKKIIRIPLSSIIGIETPKNFKHKYSLNPLLKLIFEYENGDIDEIAWYVPKLDNWLVYLSQNQEDSCKFCGSDIAPFEMICSHCNTNVRGN